MEDYEVVSQDFVFLLTMMLIVGDFYMFGDDIIPVKRDTYLV